MESSLNPTHCTKPPRLSLTTSGPASRIKEGLFRNQKHMAKVEIYTRELCPYCTAAKELLHAKHVKFIEYHAGEDEDLKQEMLNRSNGRRTFPEIFINDKHIGGFDDMNALEQNGTLDKMLQEE